MLCPDCREDYWKFQSTLPLRGVTPPGAVWSLSPDISIHTPLAGSDPPQGQYGAVCAVFQSTLPLRGVTGQVRQQQLRTGISIHTPLAGSDILDLQGETFLNSISIHTPLAGSDRGVFFIGFSLS